MINQEELYERPRWAAISPQGVYLDGARALTYQEACVQARAQLCALDASWCNATCDQIKQHVATDCTIFVGNDNPIRCALVGPGCNFTCPGGPQPGQGNVLLYAVAGAAVIGVLVIVLASQPRKKTITIGRVE